MKARPNKSNRRSIKISGYLTQEKLEKALKRITGKAWKGHEVPVPGKKRRWDMAFLRDTQTVIVEYDGDEHYRSSLKIKVDAEKDERARELGFIVVRFPYWVQLDEQTLQHYFGLQAKVERDFPHGFISTKWFPASFCELGLVRFRQELDSLPDNIRSDVILSLRDRVKKHGMKYVVPSDLVAELQNRPESQGVNAPNL